MNSPEQEKYEKLSIAITNCSDMERFNKIKALIEAEPSALKLTNKLGLRPLHETIFCNNNTYGTNLCEIFLKNGADINHPDLMGGTVLQLAIQHRKKELLGVLLQYPQLELNTKSLYGSSPLFNAVKQTATALKHNGTSFQYQTSLAIVFMLLKAGASQTNIDDKSNNLLSYLSSDTFISTLHNDIEAFLVNEQKQYLIQGLETTDTKQEEKDIVKFTKNSQSKNFKI